MKCNIQRTRDRKAQEALYKVIENTAIIFAANAVTTLSKDFKWGRKRLNRFMEGAFGDNFNETLDKYNADDVTVEKGKQVLESHGFYLTFEKGKFITRDR